MTNNKMRAKLKIQSIVRNETSEILTFNAVCAKSYPADGSDENNTFAKFSPTAELKLTVCNPALLGKFNPGECYYLDFTKAEN